MSNNVEEIPDATEKLCPTPQTSSLESPAPTVEGTVAVPSAALPRAPAPRRSVVRSSGLLSDDHLWLSHHTSRAGDACSSPPAR